MLHESECLLAVLLGPVVPAEDRHLVLAQGLAGIFQVVLPELLRACRVAAYASILAQIHGNALAHELVVERIQGGVILRLASVARHHVPARVSPFAVLGTAGIVPGVINVYGHHQSVGRLVLGNAQVLEGQSRLCHISRYADVARQVLPARSAYHIDTELVPLVEHAVLVSTVGGVGPVAPVSVLYLVERLEEEPVPLVLESRGNLHPHHGQLLLYLLVPGLVPGGRSQVQPGMLHHAAVGRRSVVVDVEDDFQARVACPSRHLGHPLQPGLLQAVLRGASYVSHPGHGDAYAAESVLLEVLEEFGRGGRVAPGRLAAGAIYVGVKVVAQVPSHPHREGIADGFWLCRLRGGCRGFVLVAAGQQRHCHEAEHTEGDEFVELVHRVIFIGEAPCPTQYGR